MRAEEAVQDPTYQRATGKPPNQFRQHPITKAGVCIRLFVALAGSDPLDLLRPLDSFFERGYARIFANRVLPGFNLRHSSLLLAHMAHEKDNA